MPVLRPLAALAAVVAAGCSQPTGAQPYAGSCDPFPPIAWDPTPNALDVPRDAPIRVMFADYPDPDTLGSADFLLWSGVFFHTGSYAVDLLDKAVIFRPSNLLRANLGYTVAILPPLHSLSGCPTEYQTRSFDTGDTTVPGQPRADVPFATIQPILARSCGGGACHRAPEEAGGGCLDQPAAGLSLCDDDAWDALVDAPSRQVGRLTLVAPHDSARSYLVRKLLPGATPDVPAPTALGQRQPPGAPLAPEDIRAIADWIDAGAAR
jgi:hypothetical protein